MSHTPLEIPIHAVSQTGAGVGTLPDGRKIFIPGTWTGDTAAIEIISDTGKATTSRYLQGRLLNISTPSADRVPSPCRFAGPGDRDCPCCPWIGIDYPAQLKVKQTFLEKELARLNISLGPDVLKPILPSGRILEHRVRAQFKTNGRDVGYINRLGSAIVPINDCPIMIAPIRHWLNSVSSQLPDVRWQPSAGHAHHFIDLDDDVVATNAEEQVDLSTVVLDRRRPFKQANPDANRQIHEWLVQKISSRKNKAQVLELFAGRGNLTRVLIPHCQKLWAAEVDAEAVEHLHHAAQNHQHVEVIHDNLFDLQGLKQVLERAKESQGLILNPPRSGLKMRNLLLDELPQLEWIAYISCTPEKMLADAKAWSKRFRLTELRGIDQFPHTPHLEAVAFFERLR